LLARWPEVLIAAFFVAVYLVPLGQRPLMSPDEARYAEIPREMLATGNWVVPHLDGFRYFEKPPLGYWVSAGAMLLFGETPFAARLPSVLAAAFAAWLLYGYGRRAGSRTLGWLGAAIFLTMGQVFAVGVFNILDSLFAALLSGALVYIYRAWESPHARARRGFAIVAGAFCGLAFLTKGFLGFAIPALTASAFAVWERDLRRLLRIGLPVVVTALLVALPWSLAIQQQEPDFWRHFIVVEHLERFFTDRADHLEPFWFFLPIWIAGALPWAVFLPAATSARHSHVASRSSLRFALCWLVPSGLLLSASHGKLATYIQPLFVPTAFLIAVVVGGQLRRRWLTPALRIPTRGVALLLLLCALGLVAIYFAPPGQKGLAELFGAHPYAHWLVCVAASLGATGLWWSAARTSTSRSWLAQVLVGTALLFGGVHIGFPVLPHKTSASFIRQNAARIPPNGPVLSEGSLAGAACWALQRQDVVVTLGLNELGYGITSDRASGKRFLGSVADIRAFLHRSRPTDPVTTLIVDQDDVGAVLAALPKPVLHVERGSVALFQFRGMGDQAPHIRAHNEAAPSAAPRIPARAPGNGRHSAVRGQAPSDCREVAAAPVQMGIVSISLTPDTVSTTTVRTLETEKKIGRPLGDSPKRLA